MGIGWISMTTEKLSLGQTGNREALQGGPAGPAAAVVRSAGLIGGKAAAGGVLIAVDLPAAHAFAVLAPVGHKPGHVLRGIAQEETDLVGELLPFPQAAGQFPETDEVGQVFAVARFPQQAAGLLAGQIPREVGGAKEIEQRPVVLPAQGKQPQAAGH